MPIPKALAKMAVPTIISQLISLIYFIVDAFFIGRTGNSYMMAAASIALTLTVLNVSFSNLFGVGGGSHIARLMGVQQYETAKAVSAYCFYACIAAAVAFSAVLAIFLDPLLRLLGASDATIVYARQYTFFVIILGSLPAILSMTLAHMLRNAGYSGKASAGLSGGGILNILLDPLFMFVLLPKGYEVVGAASATFLSNVCSCLYLLFAFKKASSSAPLSMRFSDALRLDRGNRNRVLEVGIPSALLTGLYDLANICVNVLSAAHSDFALAAIGIVMKIERLPNAINVGLCQGMLPIVAYNYSSGNRRRMRDTIRFTRIVGLTIAGISVLLLELFTAPVTHLFLSTTAGDAASALTTLSLAVLFLRIRCTGSPMQFINYNTSYCMQAMGFGKATLLHSVVRELVFYIPLMFTLDHFFGETGLALALPVSQTLAAVFALLLLTYLLRRSEKTLQPHS